MTVDLRFAATSLGVALSLPAVRQNKNKKAAVEALVEACKLPDSLIRVVFTDVDQVHEVVGMIETLAANLWMLDKTKTQKSVSGSSFTFELLNGSGIQFSVDEDKAIANLRSKKVI